MVYSGWKFILFLVFGCMTSNFICLSFSTLRSSSLWRIVTIVLSLEKAVYRLGTTSPSSRNLATVGENSKLQPKSTLSDTTVFLLKVMCFAKLNKPPSLLSPPSLLNPPQKCLKKISPPGGLIEDLRYSQMFVLVISPYCQVPPL